MATFLMNSMEPVILRCSYQLIARFYHITTVGTCRPQKFRTTFKDRNFFVFTIPYRKHCVQNACPTLNHFGNRISFSRYRKVET
ncbi:CLUMA_CG012371, isoform A [Clunio marinus]|uniref:CLUMA_CG012371, isoform A n=1 Tax=Clunio marinus TaxID=568069 RepID=A0A1J1IEI5_9DIPT|nr:CLUMA_CG012371, isoform A [Clunio marinus]